MKIRPAYATVPHIQQKVAYLANLIRIQRKSLKTVSEWDPDSELAFAVRESLNSYLRIWEKVAEGEPCQ